MLGKIRSLAKQSAVYGLGTIVTRAVAFLLLPYHSHLMSTTEFGVYSLFMVMVTVLQPLYVHGIDIAFLRFAADVGQEERRKALGTALIQSFLVGGTLSLAIVMLAPGLSQVVIRTATSNEYTIAKIAAGFILLDALANHIFTYLRIIRKPLLFSLIKLSNVIISIGLNIYFVGSLGLGAKGAFLAFFYTSAVTLLALLIIVGKEIRLSWKWSEVKTWLVFGLPNLPAMFFMVAIEFSDRKWIEAFMTIEDAGIYSAGYRIGMLMNMVAQAFRYAWQPFFLQTAKDEDARETFARVMTYYIAIACWIWLGSTLLLGYFLKMPLPYIGHLIHPAFWAGFSVFPVVMLAHIFNGIYANLMVGVYLEKKTKAIPFVIGAAAVVNIAGNGILIGVMGFGYMAAAWLTVVSYSLMCILMYFYIAPKYHVPYEWDRIVRIGLTTAAFWGVSYVLGDAVGESNWALPLFRTFLVMALPVLWWNYVILPDEKSAMTRRFNRKNS